MARRAAPWRDEGDRRWRCPAIGVPPFMEDTICQFPKTKYTCLHVHAYIYIYIYIYIYTVYIYLFVYLCIYLFIYSVCIYSIYIYIYIHIQLQKFPSFKVCHAAAAVKLASVELPKFVESSQQTTGNVMDIDNQCPNKVKESRKFLMNCG